MSRSQDQGGWTLVETLIAMFLCLLTLGGIFTTLISSSRTFIAQEETVSANNRVRTVMEIMTQEIRLAGYKTALATFDGIAEATGQRIRILADLDQDGNLSGPNEDVTYSYDPATQRLFRGSDVLADNISSFSLTYTLKDGSTTSTPGAGARIIKVKITVVAKTALDLNSRQFRYLTLASEVALRNPGL